MSFARPCYDLGLHAPLIGGCGRPSSFWLIGTHLGLALAGPLGSGVVSVPKSLGNMDRPWCLKRYGGLPGLAGLFGSRQQGMGRSEHGPFSAGPSGASECVC